MSKYLPLWVSVQASGERSVKLTFAEIGAILGFPLDHAFLRYKGELAAFGYQVGKISMKEQNVLFEKVEK